jgi:uncharacterized membrane protein YdjX (TVP38/TMEM64 family)
MFYFKARINILFFDIVGSILLVTAETTDRATFSSSFSVREIPLVSPSKCSSNPPKKIEDLLFVNHGTSKLTNPTATIPLQMIRSIRAGGRTAPDTVSSSSSLQQQSEKVKKLLLLLASTVALYGLLCSRSTWMALFNKEKLQASAVQSLESLNNFPYLYSRLLYTTFMALWEALGMSTVPVETAAGMVFGWSGLYLSGTGKLLGACLAFGLGRGALSSVIEKKLSSNNFLNLVQTSTEDNPLLVVILMKLSCFPETVKNFGSSLLKPIQWWMFVLATAVHGLTFTALWTYLGVDTAARLKDTEGLLPPDQRLKILLTLALINGCVISPLSMFYWMRTLKQKQYHSKTAVNKHGTRKI